MFNLNFTFSSKTNEPSSEINNFFGKVYKYTIADGLELTEAWQQTTYNKKMAPASSAFKRPLAR